MTEADEYNEASEYESDRYPSAAGSLIGVVLTFASVLACALYTILLRRMGLTDGTLPVVFLHHFTAVLDDWDPRVIDGIAAERRVIAFDNRGVGASGGSVPHTVDEMGWVCASKSGPCAKR